MNNNDFAFWAAMLGAALLRVITSPVHSMWRAAISILTAVFIAWVFTDAALDWLHLAAGVYRVPMGALIALTSDGIVRVLLAAGRDPLKFISDIRRGKREE